jgi:hypothetical protein
MRVTKSLAYLLVASLAIGFVATGCSGGKDENGTGSVDSAAAAAGKDSLGAPSDGTNVLDSGNTAAGQTLGAPGMDGKIATPPPVQPAPTEGNRCDQDYLIIPGVRAGNVFLNMGYEQIKACVGENNMRDGDAAYGAGTTVEGTYLYPGTPQEMFLAWAKPERTAIEFVRLATPNSPWHTKGGLKIGLTVEAVEKMNGRFFTLVGKGDEKEGAVLDWRGGALEIDLSASGTSKQFVRFGLPENLDANAKKAKRIPSTNATLRQPSVVINEMRIGIMKPVE